MNEIAKPENIGSKRSRQHAPSLAYVSASDWDSAVAKGVAGMLRDAEEAGYFGHVTTIFPFAPRSLETQISEHHRLVQWGYDAFPGAESHRFVRLAIAPIIIIRLVLLLRRLVREQAIDIVRATDPYWCGLLGWFATWRTRTAFCVSIHSDWDQRHKLDVRCGAPKLLGSRKLAKLVERFVLRQAKVVLCIRSSLIDYAVASGAPRERVRLIPHGVDLGLFESETEDVRARFNLPEHAPLVVFVGRLSRENYVYEMLELARSLSDRPDLKLVLVGGGIEEQRVRATVSADQLLSKTIVMTGFVPREAAIALRMAAAVNVVPMGGYSLIEACASGRPVVSYDVEWHSELIEDGQSGILVREGDVHGMSAAVRHLVSDPSRANQLGRAGRARAFALHDMTKVRQLKITCYEELLGRS